MSKPKRFRLPSPDHAPPGGFSAHSPATGKTWEAASSYWNLVAEVAKHLDANGLDPKAAGGMVTQHTGQRLWEGKHFAHVEVDLAPPGETSLRLGDLVGGALSAARIAFKGEEAFAPQPEAERRAAICSRCPHNRLPTTEKGWERRARGFMRQKVGGRATRVDNQLGICDICRCENLVAVHFAQDVFPEFPPGPAAGLLLETREKTAPAGARP